MYIFQAMRRRRGEKGHVRSFCTGLVLAAYWRCGCSTAFEIQKSRAAYCGSGGGGESS